MITLAPVTIIVNGEIKLVKSTKEKGAVLFPSMLRHFLHCLSSQINNKISFSCL